MIYFISEVGCRTMRNFIDMEMAAIMEHDLENFFKVSVNMHSLPRKFEVDLVYYDRRCNNVIQLSSLPLSSRAKALEFAKCVTRNNKYFTNLNF